MTAEYSNATHPRTIDRLLAAYGENHRNPWNIAVHAVAVPAIVWSALALISRIPFPEDLAFIPGFDWSWIAAGSAIAYFVRLSVPMAVAMAGLVAACIVLVTSYPDNADVRLSALAGLVFAGAWALQFIGHQIEGKRPSFFHDLQFLLIGPAWLTALVFRRLGIGY